MSKSKAAKPVELPSPPRLVLAMPRRRRRAFWYHLAVGDRRGRTFGRIDYYDWERAEDLRVVEHPSNDAAAVEIIEAAGKSKRA